MQKTADSTGSASLDEKQPHRTLFRKSFPYSLVRRTDRQTGQSEWVTNDW